MKLEVKGYTVEIEIMNIYDDKGESHQLMELIVTHKDTDEVDRTIRSESIKAKIEAMNQKAVQEIKEARDAK